MPSLSFIADVTGLVGFVATVVGFIITIRTASRAKAAAEEARRAVEDARNKLSRLSTVAACGEAVALMSEIRRLHRSADGPNHLLERYTVLKRLLISIRSDDGALSETHHAAIQGAIQQFSDMERKLERHIATVGAQTKLANPVTLNEVVSIQIDKLTEILISIQRDIQTRQHG